MTLEEISILPAEEALPALDAYICAHQADEAYINPENEEAYILRGKTHWALGHRAKAINDYLKAVAINPDSRARQALEHINAILDFYNKDLYNP